MAKKISMVNAAINTDPQHTSILEPQGAKGNKSLGNRNVKQFRINDTDVKLFYHLGLTLGTGSFGRVVSVTEKDTNKEWAMKVILKPTISMQLKAIEREISILKMVDHPNIIYLDKIYESAKNIYLILEKCNAPLSKVLKQKVTLSEDEARKVITSLLSAVHYLHSNDIIHRDLKLENILVKTNPNDEKDQLFIKLCDFGLSIVKTGHTDMVHDKCGTIRYMSPEIILSQSYSQQCDIWALGIILYTLLIGQAPFQGTDVEIANMICHNNPPFNEHYSVFTPAILNLLENMLVKNPAGRITASEALHHPWLILKPFSTQASNILDMMRQWNNDLKVPQGIESDWVSALSSSGSRRSVGVGAASKNHTTVPMSIKNIEFDRRRRTPSEDAKIKARKNNMM